MPTELIVILMMPAFVAWVVLTVYFSSEYEDEATLMCFSFCFYSALVVAMVLGIQTLIARGGH